MHPDNTVICQVKISRAAMKQLKQQSIKAPVKGKSNIFFTHI
jgi:large subunit ribosomal protein L25